MAPVTSATDLRRDAPGGAGRHLLVGVKATALPSRSVPPYPPNPPRGPRFLPVGSHLPQAPHFRRRPPVPAKVTPAGPALRCPASSVPVSSPHPPAGGVFEVGRHAQRCRGPYPRTHSFRAWNRALNWGFLTPAPKPYPPEVGGSAQVVSAAVCLAWSAEGWWRSERRKAFSPGQSRADGSSSVKTLEEQKSKPGFVHEPGRGAQPGQPGGRLPESRLSSEHLHLSSLVTRESSLSPREAAGATRH